MPSIPGEISQETPKRCGSSYGAGEGGACSYRNTGHSENQPLSPRKRMNGKSLKWLFIVSEQKIVLFLKWKNGSQGPQKTYTRTLKFLEQCI